MKLAGKLTVLRMHQEEAPTLRIHIRDDAARANILAIDITPEDLMLALTGRAEVGCLLEPAHIERLGTTMQTKIIHIEAPKDAMGFMGEKTEGDAITALLAPHEVDGWTATRADMTNIRRRCEGQKQAVTFCRWISPP